MSRSLIEYLEHILTEADFLVDVVRDLSLEQLLADEFTEAGLMSGLYWRLTDAGEKAVRRVSRSAYQL